MQYSMPIQGVPTEAAKACSWKQVLSYDGGVVRVLSFGALGEYFGRIYRAQMNGPMFDLILKPVLHRRGSQTQWSYQDQFFLSLDTQWYKAIEVNNGRILCNSSRVNTDPWSCTLFPPSYIDLGQTPDTHKLLCELFDRITKGPAITA